MMRALLRLVPILSGLALAACGGGGGDSGGAAQPPQPVALSMQVSQSNIGVNSLTDVLVNVSRRGTGVADGTPVTLSVDQPNLGQVGAASGENQSFNNSAVATTAGGQARFRFKSTTATGTAQVRASVSDPGAAPATASITLNGGPSNDNRLVLEATRTTLPLNLTNQGPFIGSPYEVEVTATWRNLRGELVVPEEPEEAMGAAWSSPDNIGFISRLDDPETTDINEYLVNWGSVAVPVNSGTGKIFVRSTDTAGVGQLRVSVVDPDTGENLNAVLNFTMTAGVPGVPGAVSVRQEGPPAYVVGSGGSTSRQLRIFITDGAGTSVPNPVSGGTAFNNVRLEIVDPEGERLSVTNAAGATQEGTTVSTRTFNGIAGAVFRAASRQGSIRVRATADRADNNVDNGITDPVVGEGTIVVSDGQLFSVTLTTPNLESLFVNRPDITVPGDDVPLPPADGTYSLTVSAIGNDRLGNPVLPGTVLQFGLIDNPSVGFPLSGGGEFALFGLNGDPQEGGTLFTSPTGAFTTAGGGAGPGDTLVLFGRDVVGNRDHEGSRIVQSVNSANSLSVTRRLNFNDDTGQSVNSGPVVPYAIGRATIGNIGDSAATNDIGVATVTMNYPVSQLGRTVIIWAQGNGAEIQGEPKTVGDVEFRSFAGLAPAELTAAPSTITANTGANVVVCLTDARGEAFQGASIGFAFAGLTSGTGAADGQNGSGVVGPTESNGCVNVNVTTGGIVSGEGEPTIVFFAAGAEAVVEITGGDEPPDPPSTVTLTINIEGGGTGDVRISGSGNSFSPPSPGGSVLCQNDAAPCSFEIIESRTIGLNAMPTNGSSFDSWSMDCSGTGVNVSLVMSSDRSCTATFNP